ncbi:MAG TPA: GAF domain-containing protein [Zeimonas sp.]|nr:GAF domain-containing protein [Zeimonas sp.]
MKADRDPRAPVRARQAVAADGARLHGMLAHCRRELSAALEQQAATSEILRVLSRSPSDLQSVLDTIIANATRLCQASLAFVMLRSGGRLSLAARTGCTPEFADYLERGFELNRDTTTARAALDGRPVQIADFMTEPGVRVTESHHREHVHTVLAVPLLRERSALGVLTIWRHVIQPFTESQIALLQTFADQAVIAIENVRLFNELETRTTQLARTVAQLKALSEVGDAVSSTLDLDTVLDTIVSRANQLAGMEGGAIYEYEEALQEFRLRATDRMPDELVDALRSTPMARGEGAIGRLATTGEPITIRDVADGDAYQSRVREILLSCGYRSLLAVPLLRNERLLGGLVVCRTQAGGFDPRVTDLLRSFATQSALAIQNARLYRELEAKSRQLEIASRHKSAFLTSMSHELRTPLNAIIGFTRIVMRRSRDRLEPKQNENLEKILASGQHLLSLIDAVLDLAKIEAGRIEIEAVETELAPVLEQCMRSIEPLVGDAVVLAGAFDRGLPRMLVDEGKLRQILINLLSNAAKFTVQGRIEVGARQADGCVDVSVSDTGIGIAADELEQIFGEFEQASPGDGRQRGGTGLGLAIARRLARLMGGDVRARSTLGAGSTFTLILPVRFRPPAG